MVTGRRCSSSVDPSRSEGTVSVSSDGLAELLSVSESVEEVERVWATLLSGMVTSGLSTARRWQTVQPTAR